MFPYDNLFDAGQDHQKDNIASLEWSLAALEAQKNCELGILLEEKTKLCEQLQNSATNLQQEVTRLKSLRLTYLRTIRKLRLEAKGDSAQDKLEAQVQQLQDCVDLLQTSNPEQARFNIAFVRVVEKNQKMQAKIDTLELDLERVTDDAVFFRKKRKFTNT